MQNSYSLSVSTETLSIPTHASIRAQLNSWISCGWARISSSISPNGHVQSRSQELFNLKMYRRVSRNRYTTCHGLTTCHTDLQISLTFEFLFFRIEWWLIWASFLDWPKSGQYRNKLPEVDLLILTSFNKCLNDSVSQWVDRKFRNVSKVLSTQISLVGLVEWRIATVETSYLPGTN